MRYLRLIERVLDHVQEIESAATNLARFIAQDGEVVWRKARDNEPTGFLTHDKRASFVTHIVLADVPVTHRPALARAARPGARGRVSRCGRENRRSGAVDDRLLCAGHAVREHR